MQIQRKMSDKLTFVAEANTQKELFEKVAEIDKWAEIFSVESCGVCKNRNIKFQLRITEPAKEGKNKGKSFKFYELVCTSPKCHAKMCFGQIQDGISLFPKKKDANGEYLPNNGWAKYEEKDTDDHGN